MKFPEHIKNKMRRIAKLHREGSELSQEVDNWFANKGYDNEYLRSGDGISLDELDYGNDITDEFCEWIENL